MISLKDSEFNQNFANILISAVGINYNTNSLYLKLETISFIDNNILKSVFEIADVSVDLFGMTLAENKLFIDIISVVDIKIKQSTITDMSGIYMNALIPNSFNVNSKINIGDTNFTATKFSSQYFAITGFMDPNDEIYVYRSQF